MVMESSLRRYISGSAVQLKSESIFPPFAAKLKAKDELLRGGWGTRFNGGDYLSPASRERYFLLTLPFIEPARELTLALAQQALRRQWHG
jgi:hypothetical protein